MTGAFPLIAGEVIIEDGTSCGKISENSIAGITDRKISEYILLSICFPKSSLTFLMDLNTIMDRGIERPKTMQMMTIAVSSNKFAENLERFRIIAALEIDEISIVKILLNNGSLSFRLTIYTQTLSILTVKTIGILFYCKDYILLITW